MRSTPPISATTAALLLISCHRFLYFFFLSSSGAFHHHQEEADRSWNRNHDRNTFYRRLARCIQIAATQLSCNVCINICSLAYCLTSMCMKGFGSSGKKCKLIKTLVCQECLCNYSHCQVDETEVPFFWLMLQKRLK